MKINRETVNRLHELTSTVKSKEEYASELLRIAQDRYNHVEHEVDREDPKTGEKKRVTVTRKVLWQEVFYIGTNSDAATILKEHHPEVFEAYAEQEKAAKNLQEYVRAEMDVDMKAMRISDYVQLTEAIVDLRLDEREKGVEADGSVKSPISNI